MNPEDVINIIDQITNKLTPLAQTTWNLLVTQMRVENALAIVFNVIFTLIAIIICTIIFRGLGAFRNSVVGDSQEAESDRADATLLRWGAIIITMIILIIPTVNIYNCILKVAIPEYYVIMNLISAVK